MIRILIAAVAVLALALGWSLWRAEVHKGDAEQAEAALVATESALSNERAARDNEHKAADRMADIGAKHEEDRRDAASVPGAVAAAVHSGALRLRDELAGCATDRLSGAAAATLERDEAARVRSEIAGLVVQVGRDADGHVTACRAVVAADREQG